MRNGTKYILGAFLVVIGVLVIFGSIGTEFVPGYSGFHGQQLSLEFLLGSFWDTIQSVLMEQVILCLPGHCSP